MRINTILFIIFCLIILVITFHFARAETIQLSKDDLPYNGYINLSVDSKTTFYINQTLKDTNMNFSFPDYVNVTNSTINSFMINYNIPYFSFSNTTLLQNTFLIYHSNLSYNYQLDINLSLEKIVVEYSYNNYKMVNQGYNLTLSTDLLPYSGSFNFTLKVYPNTTANIYNCSEWLNCPSAINFTDSTYNLEIPYFIPFGINNGTYERTFYINYSNITKVGLITFNIIEPNLTIEKYIFPEYCFSNGNDTILMICWYDYDLYMNQKYQEMLTYKYNTWKNALEIMRKNYTQIKEVEKLVMTGSIDAELKLLYDGCIAERGLCSNELVTCSVLRNTLQDEKSTFDKKMLDMENNISAREQSINETVTSILKDKKAKIKQIIFGTLGVLLLISLITWYLYQDKKLNGKWMWKA